MTFFGIKGPIPYCPKCYKKPQSHGLASQMGTRNQKGLCTPVVIRENFHSFFFSVQMAMLEVWYYWQITGQWFIILLISSRPKTYKGNIWDVSIYVVSSHSQLGDRLGCLRQRILRSGSGNRSDLSEANHFYIGFASLPGLVPKMPYVVDDRGFRQIQNDYPNWNQIGIYSTFFRKSPRIFSDKCLGLLHAISSEKYSMFKTSVQSCIAHL